MTSAGNGESTGGNGASNGLDSTAVGGGSVPTGAAGTRVASPGTGGATGTAVAGAAAAVGGSAAGGAAGVDSAGGAPVPPSDSSPVSPPPDAPASDLTGTVVPLYSYPTNAAWRMVIDAKMAHPMVPVVAVINPSNGPGASKNTDFANGITALVKAGVRVLGYVSTSYTKRAESLVHADIDTYRSWYPEVSGIFFDEQANAAGSEDYYRRVDAYARSKGLTFTVGNPGADTAPSYVGTVDVILIYESSGLPANKASGDWHANYDRHNFGIIPYGVQTLDAAYIAQVKSKVGYVYVTGDTLPNPWDTVPAYFSDLLAQLEK